MTAPAPTTRAAARSSRHRDRLGRRCPLPNRPHRSLRLHSPNSPSAACFTSATAPAANSPTSPPHHTAHPDPIRTCRNSHRRATRSRPRKTSWHESRSGLSAAHRRRGHDRHDRIAGEYTGADDLVIRRGDGAYSYNFVSVAHDGEYGITQVVRGDDLLPSTPRQVYLQKLLGYATPEYIHVPLVLNRRVFAWPNVTALSLCPSFRLRLLDARRRPRPPPLLLGLAPGAGVTEFVPESIPKQPWILDVAGLAAGPHA